MSTSLHPASARLSGASGRARRPAAGATVVGRVVCAIVAVACAAAGLALAGHYPLGAAPACALFALVAAGTAAWPRAWLVLLPAAIPLVGFAPWTGWITFEELDLTLLALAAGGYARLALRRGLQPVSGMGTAPGFSGATGLLVALFAVSLAVSFARGVADAGGLQFGWFQGYFGSMNSVRLGKSFFLALLMWPLWRDAQRADPASGASRWMAGWCLALGGASLAALWERLGFTGLLDFSSDYRTTALFWEMHVGGAAFDGFLALTVPFALAVLVAAKSSSRWLVAATVLLLASYACLTTFSRGVFLAIPAGALVLAWLALRQRRGRPGATVERASLAKAALLLGAYALAATWLFPGGGYRGMLGLLGAFAVLLRLGAGKGRPGRGAAAGVLGLVLWALVAAVALHWSKGAYAAYAMVFTFAATMTLSPRTRWLASGGFIGLVAALVAVCWRWGGDDGLARAVPVTAGLLLAALARARGRIVLPSSWRGQAALLAGAVAASAAIGVLAGGVYMTERMSTAGEDLQGRVAHWHEGLGMLRSSAQRAFGAGLGRYPAAYFSLHGPIDAPGDYALRDAAPDANALALSGGRQELGWGELLRVSQRIRPPRGPVTAELEMRSTQAADLHLEVCEKHLLYNGGCLLKEVVQPAGAAGWVPVHATLDGLGVSRGPFYAPRLVVFSVSNGARGAVLEVRKLRLVDADGSDLLVNGDFSQGLTGWLFSSDHSHLPWHLKNVFVHVLFDQGGFGLAVFVAMLAAGLWRLVFGAAREHPLAPPIAAALVGFLVVGLFDSLLDVPRDAFAFHVLLLQALSLRGQRNA